MKRRHLCLSFVVAVSLAACRQPTPTSAPSDSPSTPQDVEVLTAAALDRPLQPEEPDEGYIAGMVFWQNLRECAERIDDELTMQERRLDEGSLNDLVEREMRAVSFDFEGIADDFKATRLVFDRRKSSDAPRTSAELREFRIASLARILRNLVVHPTSPAVDLKSLFLFDAARAEARKSDEDYLLYTAELPSYDAVVAAAERGALGIVAASSANDDITAIQAPVLADVPGREGRDLPIPLVYAPGANKRHLESTCNSTVADGRLVVRRSSAPAEGEILSLLMRGRDSTRRVLLTVGRRRRALFGGRASDAMPLAVALQVFRAALTRTTQKAEGDLNFDLQVVFVADGNDGFEWLDAIVEPNVTLLGILDFTDLVTDKADVLPVLHMQATEDRSTLERAAVQVASHYRGQSAAWPSFCVTERGRGVSASSARSWRQERIPVVSFAAGIEAGATATPAPDVWVERSLTSPVAVSLTAKLGTPADSVRNCVSRRVEQQCAVAQLAALTLARVSRAWVPRQ